MVLPRSSNADDPYTRFVMFNIRNAQGDEKNARLNLKLVSPWENASISLFERKIEALIAENRFDDALVKIDQAENIFNNQSRLILLKINALYKSNRMEDLRATLKLCESIEDKKQMCSEVSKSLLAA